MEFNIKRLGLLLKRQLLGSGANYIVGIAIGTGVVLMICLAALFLGGTAQISQFYQSAFFTYLVGGIIVTSMAFTEINKPATGYQLMTLPASSLEKFLSTWLFISIVYSAMAFAVVSAVGGLLYLGSQMNLPIQGEAFNLHDMGEVFKVYFIGNIIFLAGAAAFKSNAFFKTLLCFVVMFMFFAFYSVLLAKVFGFAESPAINSQGGGFSFNGSNIGSMFSNSESTSVIIKIALSTFFLVVGFFKFKEREL